MMLVRSCSLTAIADWWSGQLGQPFQTVRERLRDTYREAEAKAGEHRAELDLSMCWAPWLAWVLAGWSGATLALALDATTLGQRFVQLVIGVVYRGCAVPVLWKVLPAGLKYPWKPEWLALLKALRGQAPPTWTVIVLADRGLYAKWLFEGIHGLGAGDAGGDAVAGQVGQLLIQEQGRISTALADETGIEPLPGDALELAEEMQLGLTRQVRVEAANTPCAGLWPRTDSLFFPVALAILITTPPS